MAKDVTITVEAYRALCNVLIEFVGRADAGAAARDHFSDFTHAILGENPHILDESNERWEVVSDDDAVMHRVRWSVPDEHGRYLWVGHYPDRHMAERDARRNNEARRRPSEFGWLKAILYPEDKSSAEQDSGNG